jgi:hypothetical protein
MVVVIRAITVGIAIAADGVAIVVVVRAIAVGIGVAVDGIAVIVVVGAIAVGVGVTVDSAARATIVTGGIAVRICVATCLCGCGERDGRKYQRSNYCLKHIEPPVVVADSLTLQ